MLPPLPEAALREALRHKLLDFLCTEGVLDTELAQRVHYSKYQVPGYALQAEQNSTVRVFRFRDGCGN